MKQLSKLFLILSLIPFGQSALSSEASYYDPRLGGVVKVPDVSIHHSEELETITLPVVELFDFKPVFDQNKIAELYEKNAPSVKPPLILHKLPSKEMLDDVHFSAGLLSYLFKSYANNRKAGDLAIPLVISDEPSREDRGFESSRSSSGLFAGLGVVESNLKHCITTENIENASVAEVNLNPKVYNDKAKSVSHLPTNGDSELLGFKILRAAPGTFGLSSNHDASGFAPVLSSFDRHLYSDTFKRNISPNMKFSELSKNCTSVSLHDCNLFFKGPNTLRVFNENFNDLESGDPEYLNLLSKVHFSYQGKPYVDLRNTILSNSPFVNYGFYTEAELAVLEDLGYDINTSEFIGNSVYQSGNKKKLRKAVLNQGFSAWDDDLQSYKKDQPSRIPLTVGTHVYGNYNNVVQKGSISSIGVGSVGIRVDGSGNTVTVDNSSHIYENGYGSSGIAVTYGSNNIINIGGTVEAIHVNGIGVNCNFGSNARSDLLEYRGSYVRARSLDAENGILSKKAASSVSVPSEIKGPLVSMMNIQGTVKGGKYAIYIDNTAHVKQINFKNRAKIVGDIYSAYEPYIDENSTGIYVKPKSDRLIPGRLQFKKDYDIANRYEIKKIFNTLRTNINFGVRDLTDKEDQRTVLQYLPDPKAIINIEGNIIGNSIVLSVFGGHTSINGHIDVKRLYVGHSVVNFKTQNFFSDYVRELDISRGGQLNLANGILETFVVRDKLNVSGNSVICVDTDKEGSILDAMLFEGEISAPDGVINLEPGLSYSEIKSLSSDPKAFYEFMNSFLKKGNRYLSRYGVTMKFPKHVWYTQGNMGRKVECSTRGCYLGDFVNSYARSFEPLPAWRYAVSLIGCILMILIVLLFQRRMFRGRFG